MKQNKRREGREAALQLLYSLENGGPEDRAAFWQMRRAEPDVQEHAERLTQGVMANLHAIDSRIEAKLENFRLERLAQVDKNILRVAVYEIFHDTTVPPVVSMNEAIEIAKRFGGEESFGFINGVLDKLLKDVTRPLR
jgi:N utilization substance protein B